MESGGLVLYQGWLKKQSDSVFKKWKLRWFVLKHKIFFQYKHQKPKPTKPEWKLSLDECCSIDAIYEPYNGEQHCFMITLRSQKQIYFSALDEKHCTEWIIALRNAIKSIDRNNEIDNNQITESLSIEKTVQKIIDENTQSIVRDSATTMLKIYNSTKEELHKLKFVEMGYCTDLQKRIRSIQSDSDEFNSPQYKILELLISLTRKKIRKCENILQLIRENLQKLSDTKTVENLNLDDTNEQEEIDSIQQQIDELKPQLEQNYKSIALELCKKFKENSQLLRDKQIILSKKNDVGKQLIEFTLQIMEKQLSLYMLKVDIIQNKLSENNPICLDVLYLTKDQILGIWEKEFRKDERIIALTVLLQHLYLEKHNLVSKNIQQLKNMLNTLGTKYSKKIGELIREQTLLG